MNFVRYGYGDHHPEEMRWPEPNLGEVEKFRHVAIFLLHAQTCCLNLAISEFLSSKSGKFEQICFLAK